MVNTDLLVIARKEWNSDLIRRYALCPTRTVVPGDLVTLHGDPNVFEVTHVFYDPLGKYAEVATAMNPVFYVQKHWCQRKEFSLTKGEEGDVIYERV